MHDDLLAACLCIYTTQVTFLKCGGVVLGTSLHHVVIDGVGAFHFMQTWTGLARDLSVSEACPSPPSHDRTPLRERSPPHADSDHQVYLPGDPNRGPVATRVYSVSPKLLADLKSRCAPGVSTYGAVTAHLWRCICVARGLPPSSDTRLLGPVNFRHRLQPPLPPKFSGNAIVRTLVSMKVGDVLANKPPGKIVADVIKKGAEQVDDAYVRSVIDHLEIEREKAGEWPRGMRMTESDLWVVSWLGMPMYDADFGWGLPRLIFPAEMLFSGMALVTQRVDRDDGINVLLALEPENLQRFEDTFYGEY